MHFNSVDLEDAADAGLAYLMRVKQFELLGALVEVVAQGDAVLPFLDFPALSPELDINGVAGLEHPSPCNAIQCENSKLCENDSIPRQRHIRRSLSSAKEKEFVYLQKFKT